MKLNGKSGAALAAAAALLVIGAMAPAVPATAAYKVKCFGVNACKGHGQCKSLGNSCSGQNACKGMGYIKMDKAACLAKGGKLTHG
jgi:uncharacterized membrane protein